MNRRHFIATLGAASTALAQRDVEEITVSGIHSSFRSGQWTAKTLTQEYLRRIDALDKRGPRINAVIEINPDALATAESLDRDRAAKRLKGPLHGIPVLLKDNIDTADKMQTTAGSLALSGHVAAADAALVARLRAAGAVILGKTNLSEWANFRSTHSVSGWSARGGQTKNPYALDRNPSGSSSGSGAAAAANLCAIAVGTETDGSITSPASMNSLVGIKPTVGLIPGAGIIPIAKSQDTAGPMTRTVEDAALLLGVMAGKDYTSALEPNGLKGARLGVARKYFGNNAGVDKLIESRLEDLRKLGAELIDPVELPANSKIREPEFEVLLYEFKDGLNTYLRSVSTGSVRSLRDLIAFNEKNREREMPIFGQEILVMAEKKSDLQEKAYLDALSASQKSAKQNGIDAAISKHRLDAIVCPTTGPAWLIDPVAGDHDTGDCTTPAAVAGYPHITVPAGFVHGLPIGLSFFGPANSEDVLIGLAFSFEQATKARRSPKYLPHAS